jgi:uroporphyrinogen decarboxylase
MIASIQLLLLILLYSGSSGNGGVALCDAWTTTTSINTVRTTRTRYSNIPAPLASMASSASSSSSVVAEEEDVVVILGKDKDKKWHTHCNNVGDDTILIRAARGEITDRTPIWLMRQAGRYMSAFREYSTKIPFRERSETPSIAVELSLQCHRAYGMDGIIMFSDILTPLPCLGNIEFDVIPGTGPVITTEIRTAQQVAALPTTFDFQNQLPFIANILQTLSHEAKTANTALIGFVGAPFTLAAYIVEQKSSKHCLRIKQMMLEDEDDDSEKVYTELVTKIATMIGQYACYQIENGAQIIQMFESWAHQLSPQQFEVYAKPAAMMAIDIIKTKYPTVPVIYYANGGSSYLEKQRDMVLMTDDTNSKLNHYKKADMIGIDWQINMKTARQILGPDVPISGNIDPTILRIGTKTQIEQAVRDCIDDAGGPGNKHVLNLGHGVMQGTPEQAVKWCIDAAKLYTR